MAKCCEAVTGSPLEILPAGLSSLPRQVAGFGEIRQELLERLANPDDLDRRQTLGAWRPAGDDFGLMWLEMWAYVADILGFYDERIANESYLGTAVRRPSLRRLVELLGYTPRAGIAGSAKLAAIADGRVAVTLPAGTAFSSQGFDGEKPQVYEIAAELGIHPLKNQWKVEAFRRRPTIDSASFNDETSEGGADKQKEKSGVSQSLVDRLLFEPSGFGLAADELVVIEARQPGQSDFESQASRVIAIEPFAGKDGKSYTRVSLDPPIAIEPDVDLTTLRARRPTETMVPTANEPLGSGKEREPVIENLSGGSQVYFDFPPTTVRLNAPIVVSKDFSGQEPAYHLAKITNVEAAAVVIVSVDATGDAPKIPATLLRIEPELPSTFDEPNELSFHHSFVDGGSPTNVCKTVITADELSDPEGVPIAGTVELALNEDDTESAVAGQATTTEGLIKQEFLFTDADETGFLVDGQLTVGKDGHATFQALVREQLTLSEFRLPLTIYGNVIDTTRGESVTAEVLGDGDARQANQQFRLRKTPLTYVQAASSSDALAQSTLTIRVDGVAWGEVKNFFGCGPADRVYTVRDDDKQLTTVQFGDGVRGSRLPSGVKNVVADYRIGAGAAAPPANHIKQLAAAVKGLRGVKSPIAAQPGKDADSTEELRSNAPRTALLLGRAVSPADFESLAKHSPGVIQAKAQWLWIPAQMQAGIVVHYIGSVNESSIGETLRSQSDPNTPIEVDQAEPVPTTASISVGVDSRFVRETVAETVRTHLANGILNVQQAKIGGTFWPSDVYTAASQIDGVVAVTGLSFASSIAIANDRGTCVESGKYLDFTVAVTAVDVEAQPPSVGEGGP